MTIDDADVFTKAARQQKKGSNGYDASGLTGFEMLDDMELSDEPYWLIEGILPRCSMVVIYGRGGSGKTYLMTSVGLGVAQGQWLGRAAEQGGVLYCAFERPDDAADRMAAMRDKFGLRGLPLAFKRLPGRKLDGELAEEICADAKALALRTGQPIRIIVVDTIAAALCGENEDAEGFGLLRAIGERLHAETGAVIFWIHHEGKADNNGPRGHTTLFDGCSVWWHVQEKETGERVVHVGKANRGPVHEDILAFKLPPFVAGQDRKGKDIVLCAVEVCDMEQASRSRNRERGKSTSPEAGLGGNQMLLLQQIRKLAKRHLDGVPEDLVKSAFLCELERKRELKNEPKLTAQQGATKYSQTARNLADRTPYLAKLEGGLWHLVG